MIRRPTQVVASPSQFLRRLFNVTAAVLLLQGMSFATLAGRALDSGAFTLSATASSGLAVSFSSVTTSVCSVTGNSVALLSVGTCTIAADQAGNTTCAAGSRGAENRRPGLTPFRAP